MPQTHVPPERVVDPEARRDPGAGRDGARTPMPWNDQPGLGFTEPGVEPWLPFGPSAGISVTTQRSDPGSPLRLVRDLIALRRSEPDLLSGAYSQVRASGEVWVYRRGERHLVALNCGNEEAAVQARGTVAICTQRARDGEVVDGTLTLGPREGAVVRVARPQLRRSTPPASVGVREPRRSRPPSRRTATTPT
jgi:alpha-glucosidase